MYSHICMCAQLPSSVQLFVTLWIVAYHAPVRGIFPSKNTRAIISSKGSSRPKDRTYVSWVCCIGKADSLPWAT